MVMGCHEQLRHIFFVPPRRIDAALKRKVNTTVEVLDQNPVDDWNPRSISHGI